MKRIGFPISRKENENRRALLPKDADKIRNRSFVVVEENYGTHMGIEDSDYLNVGFKVAKRNEVMQCDVICDAKIGDADYVNDLKHQTIFGWLHAVQNREIVDAAINNKLTGYAWEDMFDMGRHSFYRNNEIAGEAAVLHAFQCYGEMPYNTRVAVIGNGNVARGAIKILTMLGADVRVYTRATEALFRKEFKQFDVVVNAVLWDTYRKDHLIYRDDLIKMRRNGLIIDISCDRNGGVETSIPTTIENPMYEVDGISHYVVDHTPSLFHRTATEGISEVVAEYVDSFVTDEFPQILTDAISFEKGVIVDQRIVDFQKR